VAPEAGCARGAARELGAAYHARTGSRARARSALGAVILMLVASILGFGASAAVAAAPTVTSVAPTSGPTAGRTRVTITGTGFVAGATVTIGSKAAAVRVVSETEIKARTTAHAAGAAEVVVTDTNGTSTGGPTYTYIAPPTVTSIAPTFGPTAGSTAVTITGTGFVVGATVTIGSEAAAVEVVSETEIKAKTTAHAAGAAAVVVTDTNGTSTGGPTYTYIPPPTVTSIAPTSGPTAGGSAVTITGTGFVAGATVTIGSEAAAVEVVSETEIKAKTTAHAAGAAEVVVTDANGTSSGGPVYTYIAPPTVATEAASALTQTSATLNATVNPNGAEVSECKFEYGTSTGYGTSVPCSTPPGAGTSAVAVSASLVALTASTTYHFRIVASNPGGANVGADQTFSTRSTVAVTPTPTPRPTPTPTPTPTPRPTPIPNSNFGLPANALVHTKTGFTTIEVSVSDPGSLSWLMTFSNGRFGVFTARNVKCKHAQIRLAGKCRPSAVVFAKGSQTTAMPGSVIFTARPSASATKALQTAARQNKGVPVLLTLTFQSARGGQAVSHEGLLNIKLKKLN
jgi:IPT/TIG domain-containing protein